MPTGLSIPVVESENGDRDMQDRAQHFARFKFIIKLPKMRKTREIIERGVNGRIVYSRVSGQT